MTKEAATYLPGIIFLDKGGFLCNPFRKRVMLAHSGGIFRSMIREIKYFVKNYIFKENSDRFFPGKNVFIYFAGDPSTGQIVVHSPIPLGTSFRKS